MSDSETDVLKLYSPEELSPENLSPEELLELVKKEKKVPATKCIVAIPSNIDENNDTGLLVTFIYLYSTKLVYKAMPEWKLDEIDIPVFLGMKANSFVKIIEGAFMSSILHKASSVEDHIDEELSYAEAHREILKKLFEGFPQEILTQLDRIITAIVTQLASLSISEWQEQKRHVDFHVSYYFFEKQTMQLYLRTFYFNIEFKTLKVFVKTDKGGGESKLKNRFVMKYFDNIYKVDGVQMDNNRKFINEIVDKWTKDVRKEVEELVKPEIVKV